MGILVTSMRAAAIAVVHESGGYVRCRTAPAFEVGYVGVVEAGLPDWPTISREIS